jgi:chaperonin GroEL
VAEDVEGESLATIVVNKLRSTFRASPSGAGHRAASGCSKTSRPRRRRVITERWASSSNTKLSQLGRARRVVVDKVTTIIDSAADRRHQGPDQAAEVEIGTPTPTSTAKLRAAREAVRGVAVVKVALRPRPR